MGLRDKVFVAQGCRSGLCAKRPGVAPILDGASSSWLQKVPAAGQSRDAISGAVITFLRNGKKCYATTVREE